MRNTKLARLYFPGLISLCFAPLLCIWCFFHIGKFEKLTIIPVYWSNDSAVRAFNNLLVKPFDINKHRKFTKDSLTGDKHHDELVAMKLENSVELYISKKDTFNGFEVLFTKHAKYENIVELLDICENLKPGKIVYDLIDNKLFVFYPDKKRILFKHPIKPMPL